MQVVQTINDTIKVLYSPSLENLSLGDFLLVQEGKKRFLSQIIEIMDDIDEKSQNIAEIKLLFTVSENDEVLPYDNTTPSKECKILHTRQKDIEEFVNIDKQSFELAINPKTGLPLEFNLDFFEHRPLVFADKIEQSNTLFCNLAQKLSEFKHTVVFDYTGSLEIEGAKRFKAVHDFKLPLNFLTLDNIWAKGFDRASLETQAVCEEIFNEIKNFIKESKEGYLPFNRFIKVVEEVYAQTKVRELSVLKTRLIKYQFDELFANTKKEFTPVLKSKSKIVIVDLSKLKTEWHKDFSTFILDNIKENSFVLLRLNDINADADFIKELYERDLSPIPSVSYSFKRLASIVEYCPNYILLQTLNPRRDFGYVNGALCTLSPEHALLWGEDTKNFIFKMKNEPHLGETEEKEIKKPVKMKFSASEEILNIDTESIKTEDKEIKEFLELKEDISAQVPLAVQVEIPAAAEPTLETEEKPEEKIEKKGEALEEEKPYYEPKYEFEEGAAHKTLETHEEILKAQSPLAESVSIDDVEELEIETAEETKETQEAPIQEKEVITEEELDFFDKFTEQALIEGEDKAAIVSEKALESKPSAFKFEAELRKFTIEEVVPDLTFKLSEKPTGLVIEEEAPPAEEQAPEPVREEEKEEEPTPITPAVEEEAPEQIKEKEYEEEAQELEQGEIAHPAEPEPEIEEEHREEPGPQVRSFIEEIGDEYEEHGEPVEQGEQGTGSLKELVQESVETSFEDIMDEESTIKPKENRIVINENVSIDLSTVKDRLPKDDSDLPVFPGPSIDESAVESFNEGDDVEHDKYGLGKVTKVVKYANRCLLQIEFKKVGKRLLDPAVAHVRKI